jgi:hypothetical protein
MHMCERCLDRAQREVKVKDHADYCEDRFFLCDNCYNELLR